MADIGGVTIPDRCVAAVRDRVMPHMEPVTRSENQLRAVRPAPYCAAGHLFDVANTRINPADGRRICRTCDRDRARAYRAARA